MKTFLGIIFVFTLIIGMVAVGNILADFMINNSVAHTEEYTADTKTPIASLSDSSGVHGELAELLGRETVV